MIKYPVRLSAVTRKNSASAPLIHPYHKPHKPHPSQPPAVSLAHKTNFHRLLSSTSLKVSLAHGNEPATHLPAFPQFRWLTETNLRTAKAPKFRSLTKTNPAESLPFQIWHFSHSCEKGPILKTGPPIGLYIGRLRHT